MNKRAFVSLGFRSHDLGFVSFAVITLLRASTYIYMLLSGVVWFKLVHHINNRPKISPVEQFGFQLSIHRFSTIITL